MDFLRWNSSCGLTTPVQLFLFFKLLQMSNRKVTPTNIATVEPTKFAPNAPECATLQTAFQELCTNFTCADASEHLVELIRLATLAEEWQEYNDEYRTNLWWHTQCLRQFFNAMVSQSKI
jgi:hypothetical protein